MHVALPQHKIKSKQVKLSLFLFTSTLQAFSSLEQASFFSGRLWLLARPMRIELNYFANEAIVAGKEQAQQLLVKAADLGLESAKQVARNDGGRCKRRTHHV